MARCRISHHSHALVSGRQGDLTRARQPYYVQQRLGVLAELPDGLVPHDVVARPGDHGLLDEAPLYVHQLVVDIRADRLLLGRARSQGVRPGVWQAGGRARRGSAGRGRGERVLFEEASRAGGARRVSHSRFWLIGSYVVSRSSIAFSGLDVVEVVVIATRRGPPKSCSVDG